MSLVKMVLDGLKPGAFVDLSTELDDRLLKVPTGHWSKEGVQPPNEIAISLFGKKVSDVITSENLKMYSDIGINKKLYELYQGIKEMEVAYALDFLNKYPREKEGNMEKPEVAVLEGHLLGYKPCCISYYIMTRYFKKEQHDLERVSIRLHPVNPHILCYKCARS